MEQSVGSIIGNYVIDSIAKSSGYVFAFNVKKPNVFNSMNLYYLYLDTMNNGGTLNIEDIRNQPYYHSKEVNDFLQFIGTRQFSGQDVINFDESHVGSKPTIMSFIERRSRINLQPCYGYDTIFPHKHNFVVQVNILREDFNYFAKVANLSRDAITFFNTQLAYSQNPVSRQDFTLCWVRYTVLDSMTIWVDDIRTDITGNVECMEFLHDIEGILDFALNRFIQTIHEVYGRAKIVLPSVDVKRAYYRDKPSDVHDMKYNNEGFKVSDTNTEGITIPGSTQSHKVWVLEV